MNATRRMLRNVDLSHPESKKIRSPRYWMPFLVLLGMLPTVARVAQSQNNPLNFGNNFFVTGDYIVAGAYNMNQKFTTINGVSYAVGTINVPDSNPGIQGQKQVPNGAQIVAALLYWQTVEKVGAAGSGQNGYFRPVFTGGPASPGYAISGTSLGSGNSVSWSSGGCTGSSTGKVLRTYRADVAGGLPVDANGNTIANGTFEVRLPSIGSQTPLTLGATLVVIYRVLSGPNGPSAPLNSIVIYDGDFAAGSAQPTMSQQLQGFYDADPDGQNAVSRLTHIVGSGQSNKFQFVYLGTGNSLTQLPSLYGNKLPSFPGYYGNWDNTTWTFTSASQNPSNPMAEDASLATTLVTPAASQAGCVSWGAVILSTTVKDSDNDGILDSWKKDARGPGYCDAALNNGVCKGPGDPAWIDLTGAAPGQQDVFLQYDYMCSDVTGTGTCDTTSYTDSLSAVGNASNGTTTYTGTFSPPIPANAVVSITGFTHPANNGAFIVQNGTASQLVVYNATGVVESNPGSAIYAVNYSFDPRLAVDPEDNTDAVDKVVNSFADTTHHHGKVALHAISGNAILENQSTCLGSDSTCPFPNEPGTVGFREGLAYIKNQTIDTPSGVLGCDPSTDANCAAVFPHGKKDSYHYALFAHGVGLPSLYLSDGSIQSVSQSGNTVTFTTKSPHGITQIVQDPRYASATDTACPLGRVTVVFAITNPNLNGTYCVKSATTVQPYTFTIAVGGSATTAKYTVNTDPNLAVANGQVTSMSGYSDVGGQNSVIALGYGGWGPPSPQSEGKKWNVNAGTLMHEFGHTLGLSHGGAFYNGLTSNPPSYMPTFEANCKPNVQTVMSYVFQFDLLQEGTNPDGSPKKVVDYSEDPSSPGLIPTLTESTPAGPSILDGLTYENTSWFQLTSDIGGGPATSHCDGTAVGPNPSQYTYTNQPVAAFYWGTDPNTGLPTGNDINYDGSVSETMHPHNEWEGTPANGALVPPVGPSPGIDLRQISAVGTISTIGPGGEAGGLKPAGGGGGLKPAGGGGGLQPAGGGGGLKPAGGGGGLKPAGGGGLSAEITHEQANSYARPPQGLFIVQEEASPRLIDLSWFAASFGTAVEYNIYQSAAGGAFSQVGQVPGSQTSFQATVTCNPAGYQYRVTAVTLNDSGGQQESSPSNTVPAPGQPLLTGCYTVSNFSVPASATQGNSVPITWTLTDDFYVSPGTPWASATPGNAVTRGAANTLVANGPLPGNCTVTGPTTLLANGVPTATGVDMFASNGDQFTFNWNNTDNFCSGQYTFQLDLDHVNGSPAQTQTGSVLALGIDINDVDGPHINNVPLPAGTVGVLYSNTFTQDGGVGAITWSISTGSLPTGLNINPSTGVISGYATTACTCLFTVQAKDSKNNIGTQSFALTMHIWVSASAAPLSTPPSFQANPMLSAMTVGISTPDTTYQSGAVGAVTWSLAQGSLPTGISIGSQANTTGLLSGYASTAGTYTFTLLATDSLNNTGTLTFTLVVNIWVSATVAPNNPPFTAVTVLPDAIAGVPYGGTVYESGGVADQTHAFRWTTQGNADGLGFTANAVGSPNGMLTGTPTSAGIYTFAANVSDSLGNTGTQTFTITVHIFVSATVPPSITPALANGVVGAPYNNTIDVYGGTGSLTWTLSSGAVPPGLAFNAGTVSGIPTAPGTYNFTVIVTDSALPQNNGSQALTLTIAGPAQTASTLSTLVSGPAQTVVAYVAKGSWSAGNGGRGGGTGISAVNIEGSSANTAISTPGIVNSCASNSLTTTTVCTADNNDVYVLNGTTLSATLTSGAAGSGLSFQGGSCTTCGVVMDSVHNQALIAVGTNAAATGGFQFLGLSGASPTLGTVIASAAPANGAPSNISPSLMIDPTRNAANPSGSGAIVLSAAESGNFEIIDVTDPSTPTFFENSLPGLGVSSTLLPESSGEDTSTGITVAPVEHSNPFSEIFIADLTQATFTAGNTGGWADAGSQTQQLSESSLPPTGAAGVAIAQGNTHAGVITGDVGGNAITAILLPSTSGGTPAVVDWVTCTIPAVPSSAPFAMAYDPHAVTAYQSPTSGHAVALIADSSGTNQGPAYLAVVDLTQMLNQTTVPRTGGGHACASGPLPSSVVTFVAVP